jgi:hypothetical protein
VASRSGSSASCPNTAAPPQPETQDGALLSASYLANLLENVKTEGQEYVPDAFQPKFLNIMDPMCPTNNLGRSVSKANAARIRKAWAHAAHSLEDVLQQVPPASCIQRTHPRRAAVPMSGWRCKAPKFLVDLRDT